MLAAIINALLDPNTRDFERGLLQDAKRGLEAGQRDRAVLARLEAALRPLALRDNLTPGVAVLYQRLVDPKAAAAAQKRPARRLAALSDETAVFAGGCFWCLVHPFDRRPGVVAVVSGYTGGTVPRPTQDLVASSTTGHVEAVEIRFAPNLMSYGELVATFLQLIDPLDGNGQYLDRGSQYAPVIFYRGAAQQAVAQQQLAALAARLGRPLAVGLRPVGTFWPAAAWHQDFYRKQPRRYQAVMAARRRLRLFQAVARLLGRKDSRGQETG
ncbi:peptide-methionine (S)-S-oxide reductase MsrA [Lacticaseibacillus parakribbianus]|uniref:peptide-methionine (S)-S-oxide reductase MsrA n=1 Tax=Lacticaseibacillus parakribbianus TaxID=2970927 RepID=UPI0021CB1806|nr:peptide-methionine (S)-S-oxide reductase MsrA [Lacticaseibacillus parakribbianus]